MDNEVKEVEDDLLEISWILMHFGELAQSGQGLDAEGVVVGVGGVETVFEGDFDAVPEGVQDVGLGNGRQVDDFLPGHRLIKQQIRLKVLVNYALTC